LFFINWHKITIFYPIDKIHNIKITYFDKLSYRDGNLKVLKIFPSENRELQCLRIIEFNGLCQ